jgi:hypothetical protein
MKNFYLLLTIPGFILPFYFLALFLIEHGFNVFLLFSQLFANNISTFFAMDLIVTGIVLIIFVFGEAKRHQLRNWWVYLIAILFVGPSFGLPLFLYFRERRLEASITESIIKG